VPSDSEKTLERKVLRDEIKQILIEAILNRDMLPGERIIETRIAHNLQVSQAPVREAILELEQIGLVEIKPYKGAFVKKICKNEFAEAFKLRSLLEGYAIREVVGRLDSELLKEFEKLIEEMHKTAADNNRVEFIEKDVAFHELIIKSTGNKLLYRVWSMVRMSHLPHLVVITSPMSLHGLILEHEEILNFIKGSDPEAASFAVRSHVEKRGAELLENL